MHKCFLFPTFSLTLIFYLFDDNYSDRCEAIFHCSFNLHLNSDRDEQFCHLSAGHLCIFFEKCLFRPLLILKLDYLFPFYRVVWVTCVFLDINSLSGIRGSDLILQVDSQCFSNTAYWRGCPVFAVNSWHLCQKTIDYKCVYLFLASIFYYIGLYVCFYASTMLFWIP